MGDHHRGKFLFVHNFLGQFQHLCGRFRVERGSMLVEQQQLRRAKRSHQQRQRLPLAAGEQTHLAAHAILQPQAEGAELFAIHIALHVGDAPAQRPLFAAAHGQRHILFNVHGRGRAGHRVLEHAAEVLGALVFRQAGHIHTRDFNRALIDGEYARHRVEGGGFARAVAADDRDEIAFVELEIHVRQRALFGDRAGVKRLGDVVDIQHDALSHGSRPPSS